ncbi:MAG: hypothetical protein J2O48_07380 [Solirubrobacterales bacterium]|nr:hypothetical protein [Solirubrobacterales bacterium]
MTVTFIAVTTLIAVAGLVLSFSGLTWPFSAAEELGQTGTWFHNPEEDAPEALPDPNLNDAPIPMRPLRGRA